MHMNTTSLLKPPRADAPAATRAPLVELRRHESYAHDNLGFLQRMHPLRGRPFGRLVYMADSVMQPMDKPGFGMHPHVNVEVISYVHDGELTHRDSAGNLGTVPAGGLQRITAGTGIEHDESNRTGKPLRMFQIWFEPATMDVAPSYAVLDAAARLGAGRFVTMMRRGGSGGALDVNADASISLGQFGANQKAVVTVGADRAALLYVVEGAAASQGQALRRQDQLRIIGPQTVELQTDSDSLLMLIESAA
jgi:quercetin 2,3-dioxygenase